MEWKRTSRGGWEEGISQYGRRKTRQIQQVTAWSRASGRTHHRLGQPVAAEQQREERGRDERAAVALLEALEQPLREAGHVADRRAQPVAHAAPHRRGVDGLHRRVDDRLERLLRQAVRHLRHEVEHLGPDAREHEVVDALRGAALVVHALVAPDGEVVVRELKVPAAVLVAARLEAVARAHLERELRVEERDEAVGGLPQERCHARVHARPAALVLAAVGPRVLLLELAQLELEQPAARQRDGGEDELGGLLAHLRLDGG